MAAHAVMDSSPLNLPGPAVVSTIRLTAQLTHEVSDATAGSSRRKKSVRECQPPMLLLPTLAYRDSSARMSARSSSFIASASGMRNLPIGVGNAGVTSSSIRPARSAECYRERQTSLAGFFVFGVHVFGRLCHCSDRGIKIDAMAGCDFIGRDRICGPGLDGAERAAFDARNLHIAGDRIAGHPQV